MVPWYAKCQHAQKLAALGESSDAGTRENASMRMYYVVALGFSLLAGGFNHNTGGASGSILECCPIARRFDSAQLQSLFFAFLFFCQWRHSGASACWLLANASIRQLSASMRVVNASMRVVNASMRVVNASIRVFFFFLARKGPNPEPQVPSL